MFRLYAIAAVLAALMGTAIYISVLRAQNHALTAEKLLSDAKAQQLQGALETEQRSVLKLQSLATLADSIMVQREHERASATRHAQERRNDLNAIRIQPGVKAWLDTAVPDAITQRLRADPTPANPGGPASPDAPTVQPDGGHAATGAKRHQNER